MKQIVSIEGMHCTACSGRVMRALSALEGVTSCTVDLTGKEAVLEVTAPISEETLKDTVEMLGFDFLGVC